MHRTRAAEERSVILMIEGLEWYLPATEPPNTVFARMIVEELVLGMIGATRPNRQIVCP